MIAVYPGSFDPVTFGHMDIIARASDLFDTVYTAVLNNTTKQPLFTADERVEMLREATAKFDNVVCEVFEGLSVAYAKEKKAHVMVRGLRAVSDFEIELKMASMNQYLDPEIETVFMMTSSEYSFLSSSIVREVASFGGDIERWVPEGVAQRLKERFASGREGKS